MINSRAGFVIALVIALAVLEVVKARAREYAVTYVVILLLGMALYNRSGLTSALNDLQRRMKGG